MFQLAHISDIHLGPLPDLSLRELASKRITGYVNWQRHRRKRLVGSVLEALLEDIEDKDPDHLAITGDLMNLATSAEIEATRAWLETTGSPEDVSVIPGNHDAYVRGAYEKVCKAWRPWMTGDPGSFAHDRIFPYIRVRGKVALIGLSTANPMPPFLASGYFGHTQARRTVEALHWAAERHLFRVVMIHHPPIRDATSWHKRLIGIRRFTTAIGMGGAELILHGHTHLDTLNWLNTRSGRVPVVGIPSASQAIGGSRPPAGYNLFGISGEPGNWRCRRQSYRFIDSNDRLILAGEDTLTL